MKRIRFEINNHADRMAMIGVLADSGYTVRVVTDTAYMPVKVFLYVEVEDYEVEE